MLNEYGNNDTVWYAVLDVTGDIGPKGSVLEFSVWDSYYDDGGYCDAFVRLHMAPNDFSKDSYPIIYEDWVSYLNALLLRSYDNIAGFLVQTTFRSSRGYSSWSSYNMEEALKIVDINVTNRTEDNLVAMAIQSLPQIPDRTAATNRNMVQLLLARGVNPELKNAYGESALDLAARIGQAEFYFLPTSDDGKEK